MDHDEVMAFLTDAAINAANRGDIMADRQFQRVQDYIEGLKDELRRAQLLTPENVAAVADTEGFEKVDSGTGFVTYRNAQGWAITCYSDHTANFAGKLCQTTGQLEDAIAKAKGAAK